MHEKNWTNVYLCSIGVASEAICCNISIFIAVNVPSPEARGWTAQLFRCQIKASRIEFSFKNEIWVKQTRSVVDVATKCQNFVGRPSWKRGWNR